MAFDVSQYCTGYSIGVGGVVLDENKALLVHRALNSGPGADTWALPGGFVERDESIHAAVQREVLEETGIEAEVEGLIAVLNRALDDRNDTYFIFLMRASGGDMRVDGVEVADARFFALEELESLSRLQSLSRLVVIPALQGEITALLAFPHPHTMPSRGMLYAGVGK
jgi:8-oxo-dGTP diphosphatase